MGSAGLSESIFNGALTISGYLIIAESTNISNSIPKNKEIPHRKSHEGALVIISCISSLCRWEALGIMSLVIGSLYVGCIDYLFMIAPIIVGDFTDYLRMISPIINK